ncbi:MAG: Obg family GTPase CgtA [Candidatus Omnitrophica bacterium]|nr:Obg family GTPase CgtA [Candidatus Omnitrophota bacterium]
MSFIDQARIRVTAGRGGKGCAAFFPSRVFKHGKACGGDGGDGGDLIIKSSRHIQTLLDFHYTRNFKAEGGTHGSSNNKTGRRGKDFTILVPCGTIIKDSATDLVMRDLVEEGETVIVARGGKGGRGNSRFKDATPGEPGDEKEITLELKLIADVGIIGYPNAGKSTLISRISRARSKIADYPFTTKRPFLGMVTHGGDVLTFADMPGLIEGAHEGRGLGDRFLRHIERTRILLHMVDVSGFERPDPSADYESITNELARYGRGLTDKKRVIVLSKIDVPGAMDNVAKIRKKLGQDVYPISAVTGEGIPDLIKHVFEIAGGLT